MFPAQTSFIPVTVALVNFIETNGFGGLYPYWYFGTTPVKYLIGPVVPGILVLLHKFLPQVSLFDLSYFLILISYFTFSIGWGFLASRLSGVGKVGFVVGILAFLLPWRWFAAFGASEVSAVLAQALAPWVLMAFWHSLTVIKKRSTNLDSNLETQSPSRSGLRQRQVSEGNLLVFESWLRHVFDWRQAYAFFVFALLLLTNSTAAIPAIVGLLVISVLSIKYQVSSIRRALIVIVFGWFLASLWYGFDYWLTIWGAPSVGGKSLGGALITLLNGLRSILPILLAIVIVYFGTKPKNIYQKFTILWLTVFISVTLIRFMADVDFWMDWTSWMGEVEVGLVLLFGTHLFRSVHHFKKRSTETYSKYDSGNSVSLWPTLASKSFLARFAFWASSVKFLKWLPSRTLTILTAFLLIYFVLGWLFVWQKRDFWLPRGNIEHTVEFKIAKWLEMENGKWKMENGKNPKVFLSGTTAFWLNSLVDVAQVRGGRDEVSKNSDWRAINWQLTQGENLNNAVRSLKGLEVEYLVVHGDKSGEYYHDFVYPQKFGTIAALEKVYDEAGDVIYRIR